jgi:enoyl-CoA hydratase/carnithine racemase
MSTDHILVDQQDGILRIRMNRPDKKNALTAAMYTAFSDALERAEAEKSVRVTYITGTPDCFSGGNDLNDFLKNPPTGENSPVARFLRGISSSTKPMVAAVNGFAIGVGTTMLLHCDLVYAGRSARFHLPFVNIGLCPEAASSLIIPAMIGHQRAAELLMLAEPFGAERARELGFVNAVFEDSEYQDKAWEKAKQLAAQPPQALRTTKALLKRLQTPVIHETIRAEVEKFMPMLGQPEAVEAMTAFMQKRKPDFSRFN